VRLVTLEVVLDDPVDETPPELVVDEVLVCR